MEKNILMEVSDSGLADPDDPPHHSDIYIFTFTFLKS